MATWTQRLTAALLLLALGAGAAPNSPAWRWVHEAAGINQLTLRAEVYFERGRYATAEQNFKRIYRGARRLQNKGLALYGMGMCRYHRGRYPDAAKTLRQAITYYANYIPFHAALATEYKIAAEYLDGKRYFLGLFSHTKEAARAYDHIWQTAPYSRTAPPSLYRRALIELRRRDGRERGKEWLELFLTRYPDHELAPKARLKLITVLVVEAARSEGDALNLRRARHETELLRRLHPESKSLKQAERLIADGREIEGDHLMFLGGFYREPVTNRPRAARRYLEAVAAGFPERAALAEARLLGIPKLPPYRFDETDAETGGNGNADTAP